jgi:glutathione synthase/RimK-type ligase-like ATP-grasp enzyme
MRILILGGAIGGHYGARLISVQHSFADNTGRMRKGALFGALRYAGRSFIPKRL